MFVMYTLHYCGNLMHASCIEKHGKCHKNAAVKEWKDPNEITM